MANDNEIICPAFLGGTKAIPRDKLEWRPGAYGIVLHEGNILLVKTIRESKFVLPGGGIDLGEWHVDAMKREMLEETGIDVEVGEMVGFLENIYYYDPSDKAFHTQQFFYRCKPLTFDVCTNDNVLDDEVESPQWVAIKDLTAENFFYKPDFTFDLISKVFKAQT